jgi:hypothetical protein
VEGSEPDPFPVERVGDVPSSRRMVSGEVGEVASEERKVCAAGERLGLESSVGRSAFSPGSSDGSSGKSKCRVRDPVA